MKTITTFFILFSFLSPAMAQGESASLMERTTPDQRAQFQTDYMKENLKLTPDQEGKVHEVNLKYARKIQDAYNAPGRKVQKLKKMKAISDEKDKELKSVLSPDQFAAYEKNKEAMKTKIREKAKEKREQN